MPWRGWLLFLCALATCLSPHAALAADEFTLFDAGGAPVAYIAVQDALTIYLWDGTPVAYLHADTQRAYHVYAFDGTHLGWYQRGIIWDHMGNAVGGVMQVFADQPQPEPPKPPRDRPPLPGTREQPPPEPPLALNWSSTSLADFLNQTPAAVP